MSERENYFVWRETELAFLPLWFSVPEGQKEALNHLQESMLDLNITLKEFVRELDRTWADIQKYLKGILESSDYRH